MTLRELKIYSCNFSVCLHLILLSKMHYFRQPTFKLAYMKVI